MGTFRTAILVKIGVADQDRAGARHIGAMLAREKMFILLGDMVTAGRSFEILSARGEVGLTHQNSSAIEKRLLRGEIDQNLRSSLTRSGIVPRGRDRMRRSETGLACRRAMATNADIVRQLRTAAETKCNSSHQKKRPMWGNLQHRASVALGQRPH